MITIFSRTVPGRNLGTPIDLLKSSVLKAKVSPNYKLAIMHQYMARPEGKKTVIGKDKKGMNLKYLAALANITLDCELMLGLN
jgi:hypothetical protein